MSGYPTWGEPDSDPYTLGWPFMPVAATGPLDWLFWPGFGGSLDNFMKAGSHGPTPLTPAERQSIDALNMQSPSPALRPGWYVPMPSAPLSDPAPFVIE